MKIHSNFLKSILFCIVLLLFVLPSLIIKVQTDSVFTQWNIPVKQFSFFVFSLFLIFCNEDLYDSDVLKSKYSVFYKVIFPGTFCFCLLFCFSLIFKSVSVIFSISQNNQIMISKPEGFIQWLYCILNFLFAAFFEETLYRFFLPQMLLFLLKDRFFKVKKFVIIGIEVLVCLSFAFAHSYLGILAVLNAVSAHLVLRSCYKKTGTILAGFAGHFIYNLLHFCMICFSLL